MVSGPNEREVPFFKGCGDQAGCIMHHLADGFDMSSMGCLARCADAISISRRAMFVVDFFDQACAELAQVVLPCTAFLSRAMPEPAPGIPAPKSQFTSTNVTLSSFAAL